MRVLVAGARGFVGRALCPALRAAGHDVVEGARPAFDVDDDAKVARALAGIDVAVWLVHGLRRGHDYDRWERQAARRFGAACAAARSVQRIVYLGGLVPRRGTTRHLESRHATARALAAESGVDLVQLRAGMIVGAGSQSWLLARDAAARVPVFLCPPWLAARQQPVALEDVVAALLRALTLPAGDYNVPGPDALTGREIVERTARLLGREHARFVDVALLPRRLAARLAPLITRADGAVARELFRGAGLDLVVDGDGVFAFMPEHRRVRFDDAAAGAIGADRVDSRGARAYERLLRVVTSSW